MNTPPLRTYRHDASGRDYDLESLYGLTARPLPVVALIVAASGLLGLSAVQRKSMTYDEGIHVTGGVSYWQTNDYRLQPENGNWSQRLVALPGWLGGFIPPAFAGHAWQASDVRTIADQYFYDAGNDADTLLWRSRLMMAIPSRTIVAGIGQIRQGRVGCSELMADSLA